MKLRSRTFRMTPSRTAVHLLVPAFAVTAVCCGGNGEEIPDALQDQDRDSPVEIPSVEPCPTTLFYDPIGGGTLGTFPDDFYTVDDKTSPTGIRVRIDPQVAPWLSGMPSFQVRAYEQLSGLDGFGNLAAILFRFDGSLAAVSPGDVYLMAVEGDDIPGVPVEVESLDSDRLLVIRPLVPLQPGTRYGVVLSRAVEDASGGCVDPGPVLRSLWDGTAVHPDLVRLVPGYTALKQATGLAVHEISAAVVFTTQQVADDSIAVAADIAARDYQWSTLPACTDEEGFRRCEGSFTAWDYRGKGGVVSEPVGSYELPVSLWLPPDGAGPWPVFQFGHGAGESRVNGGYLAEHTVPMGISVLAVDAIGFGDHPTSLSDEPFFNMATLLAIDLEAGTLDAHALRTGLRQTAYDRLQLARLAVTAPDIDGDGIPDLDGSRMGYAGYSLGGITGGELLALGGFDIALLSVAGARMTSILGGGVLYYLLLPQVVPADTPPAEVAAYLEVVQAIVDRGEPANFAARVLANRLPWAGDGPPHLLVNMAIGDEYVSNVSSLYLARSLGVPHLAPEFLEVGEVSVVKAPIVSGNLHDGTVTAALFQYDRVTPKAGGAPVPAGHDSTPVSPEAVLQCTHFLQTWLDKGIPEILDPYQALKTPPLD